MNRPTLTVSGQAREVVASDGSVVLHVPINLRQRSGRRVVAVGGSGCESSERIRTAATPLQLALARGHRWLRMLESGDVSSLREIAQRDRADHSYVAKHINLTLLAPDIVAAILDDALPDGVRLSALLTDPPVLWEVQREALGTTPAPPRVRKVGPECHGLLVETPTTSARHSLMLAVPTQKELRRGGCLRKLQEGRPRDRAARGRGH